MDDAVLLQTMNDLIGRATSAILTTLNAQGWPETRAMLNLHNPNQFKGLRAFLAERRCADDLTVYFTTNADSAKMAQIRGDRRSCAYYHMVGEFRGLMLSGPIEPVDDKPTKDRIWQPGWELYYRKGVDDPDYAVLRLRTDWAKYYHGQETHTLRLRPGHYDPD